MVLTPYDTGARLQPVPWNVQPRNLNKGIGEEDRYGRVDFDNDEGATLVRTYVEKTDAGYVLHIAKSEQVTIEVESN